MNHLALALLIGVPLAIPTFVFAVLYLEWFVALVVLGSIFFPMSLVKAGGSNIDGGDLCLLLALVSLIINFGIGRAPSGRIGDRPYFYGALAFWFVNTASILWSVHISSTVGFSIQLIELLFVYPLVVSLIPQSVRTLRIAALFLLLITVVLSLITIAVLATGGGSFSAGTAVAGFGKNPMGSFTAAGAAIAVALWFTAQSWKGRLSYASVVLVNMLGTVATGSRGAMLGLVGAVLLIVLLTGRGKANRWLIAAVVVAFFAGAYFLVVAPHKQAAQTGAGSYSSADLRLTTWRHAIKKIEKDPWVGTGARTYIDHVQGGTLPDPNNLFLLTWAEVGVPGMIALLLLLGMIARLCVRLTKLPRDALALAAGAAGVILSLLLHFQVDVSWSRGESTLVFAMVGVIIALLRLVPAEVPEPEPVPARTLAPTQPAWMRQPVRS